jgi:anti-sigma factor RsiW
MSPANDNEIFDEPEDSHDPQLTELVAYLDGELDEVESTRLERQLATDPPLRGYAESLDRTWQLLDNLGEATASGEFTQKTLASLEVISDDGNDTTSRASAKQPSMLSKIPTTKILLWTIAGFVGCSIGIQMAHTGQNAKKDSEDVQILRQLDLLKDFPKLYPIPDAEFLKQVSSLEVTPIDQTN